MGSLLCSQLSQNPDMVLLEFRLETWHTGTCTAGKARTGSFEGPFPDLE